MSEPPVDPAPRPSSRQRLLEAASAEFAAHGLGGARIEAIADRAGVNKALIYHYFESKDGLFGAVLEAAYEKIRRAERALSLAGRAPVEGMRQLVEFSFDYVAENPDFVALINDENLHGGTHVAHSQRARDLNSPLVPMIAELLARGAEAGQFRQDVDPVQLYITIASLCYFHQANRHTLSAIFALSDPERLRAMRRRHAVDVVLGYLRP